MVGLARLTDLDPALCLADFVDRSLGGATFVSGLGVWILASSREGSAVDQIQVAELYRRHVPVMVSSKRSLGSRPCGTPTASRRICVAASRTR
jgi:hypothetical protein